MRNILTIYRFNTPFLDIEKEKDSLKSVKEKIKIFLLSDWIEISENNELLWNYNVFTFISENIKIRFKYIKTFENNYYMPVFKMDIYILNDLINNNTQKIVLFLTNLMEVFDWLNEKEYLIDIDDSIFYKKWILSKKIFPIHDFTNIDIINKEFENKNWENILEDFITNFKNKDFILTRDNSNYYHKIHSIFLYYIYLVYLMHKNINESQKTITELESCDLNDFSCNIELSKKRLKYINDLSIQNFNKYYSRLEIFFKLFN